MTVRTVSHTTLRSRGETWHSITRAFPDFDGTEPCTEFGLEVMYPEGMLTYELPSVYNPETQRMDRRSVHVTELVCGSCPLLVECREWGLAHEEHGIWGGMYPAERVKERRRRRQLLVSLTSDAYVNDLIALRLNPIEESEDWNVQGYGY